MKNIRVVLPPAATSTHRIRNQIPCLQGSFHMLRDRRDNYHHCLDDDHNGAHFLGWDT